MSGERVAFNHVGLCVSDLARSRYFYENVLDFVYWWELNPPDEGTSLMLQLEKPVGLKAAYLLRGGLVLELLEFLPERREQWRKRSMAEPGLTHLSLSVADLDASTGMVERFGGTVIEQTRTPGAVMIRDPDGQLLELLTFRWRHSLPPLPPDV